MDIAVAFIASACFGASFGYNYGVENQLVYMLSALRLLDPSILGRDWFLNEATQYHFAFKYVAAALIAISPSGLAVGIAQNAVIAAGMMCLYWLLWILVGRRRALPAFLLLVVLCFMTRTGGAGASYVFDFTLQPSTLASVALLAALPFFAQGRWLASSACVALGGLFHANYLVLLILAFGLAHLLMGRQGLAGRLLLQLTLPLLVLPLFLPTILRTAGSPGAKEAQAIFINIRCPHHFIPANWERNLIPYAAWQMIGMGASLYLFRRSERVRRLGALIGALLVVIWGGLFFSTLVPVPSITMLFTWRLGPNCMQILEALACAGAVSVAIEPRSTQRFSMASAMLLIGGIALLCVYCGVHGQQAQAFFVLEVGLLSALSKASSSAVNAFAPLSWRGRLGAIWARLGPELVLLCSLAAVSLTAYEPLGAFRKNSTVFSGFAREETEMYAWMRQSTPKDALFLTPPGMDKMRFHGQRAIVVDWKSGPIVPGEILEWFRRLKDVTGRPNFASSRDLEGYNSLDMSRLELLRDQYKIDYVVVYRGYERALSGYPVAYSNPRFVALDVRKKKP